VDVTAVDATGAVDVATGPDVDAAAVDAAVVGRPGITVEIK